MTNAKAIDFSKTSIPMRGALLSFIRGLRGPRENPVSTRDIERHFSATPKAFILAQLDALQSDGYVAVRRNGLNRKKAGCVYEITEAGQWLRLRGSGYKVPIDRV